MKLTDESVMELLDWHPEAPAWTAEWRHLYDRCPPGGWRRPAPDWVAWAQSVLSQPPDSRGHQTVIARILCAAEPLHPQGLERRRLRDALLAVGGLQGRDYQPADVFVDDAERSGIIRMERTDLWRPGMPSGSGLRTFCRLTLYGRSLVQADAMPEPFPPLPEPESWRTRPADPQPPFDWFERARTRAAQASPTVSATQPAPSPAGDIPDDFSWTGPFVDQQVRKFFRRHWDEYTTTVQAVVNAEMKIERFTIDFGPKRISEWINETLRVRDGHPNPCTKQNINGSATYGALVKAFKENPREHAVVQRLQHGQSAEAQAILDEFLSDQGAVA
jgi:hypothetical protein